MGKNWLIYLLALAGTVVFHAFYFGWYSWFLLVLAAALPLFSLLVSLPAMLCVRLSLDAPRRCMRTEPVYVTLRAASGFWPMPRCRFRLVVRSVLTGREVSLRQQVPGQESWYVPLDTAHCGALRCRLERARVYDYLGLFFLPVRRPQPVEVVVQPQAVQPEKLPNLRHFMVRRNKPKPGGGFSEEHELRDYRPGDSMRDIHWKLSAKTDRTIVREAQEPVRGKTLLTFDLEGPESRVDGTLERLLWLSGWLLEHDTPHQIIWIDPSDCQLATVQVERPEDLEALLDRLLHTALRDNLPSIAGRRFSGAAWRCHVEPEETNG